jgi:hypothetical protein
MLLCAVTRLVAGASKFAASSVRLQSWLLLGNFLVFSAARRRLQRARFAAAAQVVSDLDEPTLRYLLRSGLPAWVKVRHCHRVRGAGAAGGGGPCAQQATARAGRRQDDPSDMPYPPQFGEWERASHLQTLVDVAWPVLDEQLCRCRGCCWGVLPDTAAMQEREGAARQQALRQGMWIQRPAGWLA